MERSGTRNSTRNVIHDPRCHRYIRTLAMRIARPSRRSQVRGCPVTAFDMSSRAQQLARHDPGEQSDEQTEDHVNDVMIPADRGRDGNARRDQADRCSCFGPDGGDGQRRRNSHGHVTAWKRVEAMTEMLEDAHVDRGEPPGSPGREKSRGPCSGPRKSTVACEAGSEYGEPESHGVIFGSFHPDRDEGNRDDGIAEQIRQLEPAKGPAQNVPRAAKRTR